MLEDNKVMKFYLILPPRQSKYGALFNIYADLLYGFKEINVSTQVIEIDLYRNIILCKMIPYYPGYEIK